MSRRSGGAAASWSFGILVICFRAVFFLIVVVVVEGKGEGGVVVLRPQGEKGYGR